MKVLSSFHTDIRQICYTLCSKLSWGKSFVCWRGRIMSCDRLPERFWKELG